jgi:hypothetical protein
MNFKFEFHNNQISHLTLLAMITIIFKRQHVKYIYNCLVVCCFHCGPMPFWLFWLYLCTFSFLDLIFSFNVFIHSELSTLTHYLVNMIPTTHMLSRLSKPMIVYKMELQIDIRDNITKLCTIIQFMHIIYPIQVHTSTPCSHHCHGHVRG